MVWNFEAQNIPYRIEYEKNKISINNAEPVKLRKFTYKNADILGQDWSIPLEGTEAVLHIRAFRAPVLSYNGRDCATGEEYIPAKVPGWTWVFIILHAIDFFLILGGALGGGIQAAVNMLIASVASNTKRSIGVRILMCAGIWLLSTALQFVLVEFLLHLRILSAPAEQFLLGSLLGDPQCSSTHFPAHFPQKF